MAELTSESLRVSPGDSGQRLDRLLASRLPELSRSRIKSLILSGNFSVDGQIVTDPACTAKAGQTLTLEIPAPVSPTIVGQDIPLVVRYEDSELIVIDKPAGLVVHPAAGNPDCTLVNALVAHCGSSLGGIGGSLRPGIVHRLDKDTSGLLVAAKTDVAHQRLSADFAARRIERSYLALVWGLPEPREGQILGAIGRNPANRKKMAVVRRGGKAAETHYRVLNAYGQGLASLLECRLKSGRTHQIRVHLSHRGYPIIGDRTYGRSRRMQGSRWEDISAAIEALGRQALHAASLGFTHPVTGETLLFKSKLPHEIESLKSCLESL